MRGDIETSELPPHQATLAETALQTLPVDAPPAPPHHPDGFQYEIAFSAGRWCIAIDADR